MTESSSEGRYLTPDRKTKIEFSYQSPADVPKMTYQATKETQRSTISPRSFHPTQKFEQTKPKNERKQSQLTEKTQRLRWLQSRVGQLKIYLTETAKISKKVVNNIFGWNTKVKEISQQRQLVKELGVKVQLLLKQNNKLRHFSKNTDSPEEEPFFVKELGSQLSKKKALTPQKYAGNQIQDHREIVQYMQKNKKKGAQRQSKTPRGIISNDQNIQNKPETQQLLTAQKLKSLKKYFTVYINTCIEQNDERFAGLQKYVKSIEQKMKSINTIEQKLDHLKFQKQVKLQQASKLPKNTTMAGPIIPGDISVSASDEIQIQINPPKQINHVPYFPSKKKIQKITDEQLQSEFISLMEENKVLKEQLQNLKLKYEKQIENHIRDNAHHEQMMIDLQQMGAQNNCLWEEIKEMRNKNKKT